MEPKSTKVKNFTNNYGVIMFSSLCFKRMYVIARSFQRNFRREFLERSEHSVIKYFFIKHLENNNMYTIKINK